MKYIYYNPPLGHGYMDCGSNVGNPSRSFSLHDWVDSTGRKVVLRCTSRLGPVISAAAKQDQKRQILTRLLMSS